MNEKLYEALEVCLQALETGAEQGSFMRLFPGLEDKLLPLLETSRQASLLRAPVVPDPVFRRGRARVLQHASEMRAASLKKRKQKAIFTFSRLAVSFALAILLMFSGTELARASGNALPGDNLYPVKRTLEDVRLLLEFNPASRQTLEGEFEQERLHEVDKLLAEGRHEIIQFAGVVTEQNGNLWIVSGVPVQITPETRLPADPVTAGASILLAGRTNEGGFVEAERIDLLSAGIILPTSVPTPVESLEGPADHGESEMEQHDDSGQYDERELDPGEGQDKVEDGELDNHSEGEDRLQREYSYSDGDKSDELQSSKSGSDGWYEGDGGESQD